MLCYDGGGYWLITRRLLMKSAIPSELVKLKKRFEAWRKTRAKRSKTPDPLLKAAAALLNKYSCAFGWLAHSRARLQICSSNLLDQLLDFCGNDCKLSATAHDCSRKSCAVAESLQSFRAQGNQLIYLRRPPRRQPARQQRYTQKQQGNHAKGQRVGRADVIQQTLHHARQAERTRQTQRYAPQHRTHALSDDQPQHVARSRAQRQPNADFMRA